jgi:hypothetical protein
MIKRHNFGSKDVIVPTNTLTVKAHLAGKLFT